MYCIKIDTYTIEVERKNIKHLRLSVYPTQGRIHVSAPLHYDDEQITAFVRTKIPWIARHFERFELHRQVAELRYVSGEIHFLEGKAYQLNVISTASVNKVCIREDRYIDLYEKPGTAPWHRPLMLQAWYGIRLKVRSQPLLAKWEGCIGAKYSECGIKQMKTRWGSCNINARRIWLNLELAKRPDESLEYIIVHELMHLLEKGHNARFHALMDKHLPDWRERKHRLDHFGIDSKT